MTTRVGSKGQVVIPKALRERLQLHPGDEVDLEVHEGAILLTPRAGTRRLGGRFAGSGMASRLLQERAAEPR